MLFFLGVGELAGDGNVFLKKNINAFHEFVMKQTKGKGIHFMMADGVSVLSKLFIYLKCIIKQYSFIISLGFFC